MDISFVNHLTFQLFRLSKKTFPQTIASEKAKVNTVLEAKVLFSKDSIENFYLL